MRQAPSNAIPLKFQFRLLPTIVANIITIYSKKIIAYFVILCI